VGSPYDYLERCNTLAVLGGTFDPIHLGHLAVAEAVLNRFKPQRMLFMPTGDPPHKPSGATATGQQRYQMALAATCTFPAFDVSALEVNRIGQSFTFDTLKEIRSVCPTNAVIYLVIGADAFLNILTWKNAETLLTMCEFVTVPRPGYDTEKLTQHIHDLTQKYNASIHMLNAPLVDISSTEIRRRFASGESVKVFLPQAVQDYAVINGIYSPTPFPRLMSRAHFEWAKHKLKAYLSVKRFTHTMGTVKEAERLAKHYGEDVNRARWAALLHDCAKEYSAGKKRMLCQQWGVPLDEVLKAQIDLTYSLLGAESARRDFFVYDEAIHQAIRYHTTGHGHMTMLDKIIMLADYIEPYREAYFPLQQMRELAYTDINKALILGTKSTIAAEKTRNNPIHRWSKDALRELKKFVDDDKPNKDKSKEKQNKRKEDKGYGKHSKWKQRIRSGKGTS